MPSAGVQPRTVKRARITFDNPLGWADPSRAQRNMTARDDSPIMLIALPNQTRPPCYPKATMLNRIAKCRAFVVPLLCALVVLASLDRLPDPPAVSPHPTGASVISSVSYSAAFFDQHQPCGASHSAPLFPVDWFDFARKFGARCLSNCAPLVRQASGSSPPSFA
jgi:hypothetical protein